MPADLGVRSAARLWYAKMLADAGSVPYARDEPTVRAGAGAEDRVLLIGNGPAHGWGVASHRLALCGQLAEAVAEATGGAAVVDFVGAELMNAESARAWLGDRDLAGYDAVVIVMGVSDAVRLTPVEHWERDLVALLEHVRGGLRHDAPIVVSGVPPLSSVPMITAPAAFIGQRRADAMNVVTERIVKATPGAAFVPLGPAKLEPGRPYGSARSYRASADVLAAVVAPLIDARRERAVDRRRARVEEQQWTWPAASALLDAAAERGTPELRRLVESAKIEFDVTLAAVTYLEGDRMWFAAASADTPLAIPRSLSYDQHVPEDRPLIVPNADEDPRWQDNPFIAQAHLPFYAGCPVHDRSGRMIGTFCVLAAFPRSGDSVSVHVLRTYAVQAERELHRLEVEALGVLTA